MSRKAISWRVRGDVIRQAWFAPERAYICHWCMTRMTIHDIAIDHHEPLAAGGTDDLWNLAAICNRCNSWKSDKSPEEAETHINKKLELEWAK